MAERVVVDASIGIALLVDESGTRTAQSLVEGWRASGKVVLVPSHFWLQVANVLMRRHDRTAGQTVEGLVVLDEIGLVTIQSDRATLLLALDPMERRGLAAYDALYLAMALSTNARLATFDDRLADAARAVGIIVDPYAPRRLAETPAEYVSDESADRGWLRSAVIGRHIAELRHKALARPLQPTGDPTGR